MEAIIMGVPRQVNCGMRPDPNPFGFTANTDSHR